MSRTRLFLASTAVIGAALLWPAPEGSGNGFLEAAVGAKALNKADDQVVVQVTDFVADAAILVDRFGIVHHPFVMDPNLVNPWGTAESPASPIWVSDNVCVRPSEQRRNRSPGRTSSRYRSSSKSG